MTTEEFIQKAKAIHGDKFDYSKVEYVNNHTPIIINCPIHGEFQQTPSNHLRGQGCSKCRIQKSIEKRIVKKSPEEALRKVMDVLKGTPYELVLPLDYKYDWNTNVKLHCTIHDTIWDIGYRSLLKHENNTKKILGCPECRQVYRKEDCAKAAKLFTSRSEFGRQRPGEYMKAMRMGWLDEVCAHMKVVGNRYRRCIYVYLFEVYGLKYVYVGLTAHLEKRDKEHRTKARSSVNKFALLHEVDIPSVQQVTNYLPKEEAAQKEGEVLKYYLSLGYIPINRTKTGGLGGHLLDEGYTYEQCLEKASRYRKRSEWKLKDYSTYYVASKYGWIDSIMPQNKPYGNKDTRYWTIERCREAANECSTISEFREKYESAYVMVCKNNWNDVVFSNIPRQYPPTGFTIEIIKEKLKGYSSTSDFVKENPAMLNWLGHQGIRLTEIATSEQMHNSRIGTGTKPIVQCDMEGNFVAEYNSAREPIGFSYKKISACCNGKNKSHKGYKWFFKQDYEREHSKE